MFELSALLKMQLPVLSSFAIFKWVIGLLGYALIRRGSLAKVRIGADPFRRTLFACGMGFILFAYGHAFGSVNHSFDLFTLPFTCHDYFNHKVLGYLCASSLLCLATSNKSIDLGLSIAALKGIADMSGFALFLAPAVWIRQYCKNALFFTVVILLSLSYSTLCYKEGPNPAGSAVLAVCFSLIYTIGNAAFASLFYGLCKVLAGAQSLRALVSKLVKRARGLNGGL